MKILLPLIVGVTSLYLIYLGMTPNTTMKIAVLNDIHYERYYDPLMNNANC